MAEDNKENNKENHDGQEELHEEQLREDQIEAEDEEAEVEGHLKDSPETLLKQELGEMKDKYLRLYSEFENFRRRTSREKLDFMQNANLDLIRDLIPVVDDFDRAMNAIRSTKEVEAIEEGVELVRIKFNKILESKGLKAMNAKGEPFDSELHEAVTQIPAPSKEMKGKVVDEIEKGYFLNDKVVRHAKVVTGA